MPLSLEHSAFVIAANVPELERRYRRLAEEISLVASHLADTEPELPQLTKLRDEIEFAAEYLKERSESVDVQAAATKLSSACKELTVVLFEFRRHHNGSQTELDEPHPLGADMLNDLSDELGEDRDFVAKQVQQPIDELFEKIRTSAARIKSAAPDKLAPLYELDEFFATAANSVAPLDDKARFDKVQQEIIPTYRALFEKCCEAYPRLKQHFAESFDDRRFSNEMIKHRQLVLDALKDIENIELPGHTLQVSNDNSLVAQRHSYGGVKLPGEPSGWHALVKDGVTLYGRPLKLQNKPARLLMMLIISRKRLSAQDLACVSSSWKDDIDSADDEISASGDNNVRTALSRLRRALCEQLGIPKERQSKVTNEYDVQPTVWELNWELLDEYGLAKGEHAQD